MTGRRAIDKAPVYEQAIRSRNGNASLKQRQFRDNYDILRTADDVHIIDGKRTAIDAKYVDNWQKSYRNPESYSYQFKGAAERQKLIDQARRYEQHFDGGAVYHTNSIDFANYYNQLFINHGIRNIRFEITPTVR